MIKKIKDYFTKEEEYDVEKESYEEDDLGESEEYNDYEEFKKNDDYNKFKSDETDEDFSLSTESNKKCEVVLISPDTFNDALKIANDLKNNRMIILNLDDIEFEEGRKIVDFLSGTVYALGGSVNKISSKIILLAPIFIGVHNTISLRKKEEGLEIPIFKN